MDRTVRSLIQTLTARLAAGGLAAPQADAEWLLAEAIGVRRTDVYLWDHDVDEAVVARLEQQVTARLRGVPLQYVLGTTEFFGHRLTVAPGVFIPRPETEVIVEAALAQLTLRHRHGQALRILELGTGSGAIAISLAKALPGCVVVAVELSWNALRFAQENVRAHRLSRHIYCVQSRWASAIRGVFDAVISNPPYIAAPSLPDVMRLGDPLMSVDGGPDGMRDHRQLLAEGPRLATPEGLLLMECAEDQATPLAEAARAAAYADVRILHDLAGRPRAVQMTLRHRTNVTSLT